jgi:hypothetical protein
VGASLLVRIWGGENRSVYRWKFNPILVPYLKVSGVRNDEQRHWHLTPETGIREGIINRGYFLKPYYGQF